MGQKLWRGVIALFLLSNVALLMAQTETFPRWRMVGGTSGVPLEVTSGGALLITSTGSAAAADSGLASTLPRYRLAGGVTGNLAEVDSTGHMLVASATGGGLASTGSSLAQFAATTSDELAGVLTNETGTGVAVFATAPTLSTVTVTDLAGTGTAQLRVNATGTPVRTLGIPYQLAYCGQAAENGTIYFGEVHGANTSNIGASPDLAGVTCDSFDSSTEAGADHVTFQNNAFKVLGMYCTQSGAEALGAGETIVLTYRVNTADATPTITCTISEGQTGCSSLVETTVDVPAAALTDIKAVMTSNNSDQDLYCMVPILIQ